jgi:heme/copper-type cytochrome/quinol oxidase subunit 2
MKSRTAYLVTAFIVAFGVMVLIPVWFALDAVEFEAGDHHGGGEMVPVEEFESKVREQMNKYGLPDGSVRPPPGNVYIVAEQFEFIPGTIRLTAGEHYSLVFLSPDVLHGVSLIQEKSLNSVVMPEMSSVMSIEPMRQGEILILCNEYCGEGHDLMKGKIIVEARREGVPEHKHGEEEHHEKEEHHEEEKGKGHHDEKEDHHHDEGVKEHRH